MEKLGMSVAPRHLYLGDNHTFDLQWHGPFAAVQIHNLQIRSCYPKPSFKLQVKQLEYVS